MDSLESLCKEFRDKALRAFRCNDFTYASAMQRQVIGVQKERRGCVDFRDHLRLAMYLTAQGRLVAAARHLELVSGEGKDSFEYFLNIGTIYLRLGRLKEARAALGKARKLDAKNSQVSLMLSRALLASGEREKGIRMGQVSLLDQAREAAAFEAYPIPREFPEMFHPDRKAENIIAFVLDDVSAQMVGAAIRNALRAVLLYPDWTCRFYVPASIPRPIALELSRHGAQIVPVKAAYGRFANSEFWALNVFSDPAVRRFMIRDIRNLLNEREQAAVREWIESKRWFHVMRDHPSHGSLIVPGLWGGIVGALPPVEELMQTFHERALSSGSVMRMFLQQCIWPTIRKSCLQHDSTFRVLKSTTFPAGTELPGGDFVGNPIATSDRLPHLKIPEYEMNGENGGRLVADDDGLPL